MCRNNMKDQQLQFRSSYNNKITDFRMQNLRSSTPSIQLSNMKPLQLSHQDNGSQSPKCINLPKVKCAFHPQESITNFCTCESCLLPLCPSCVKIHTIEHVNMKKISPQYQPITDLLEQIYGQVQELINQNNEYYKKILQVDARVGAFRSTIQQKILSVKQSILNEVQKYFSKLDDDVQAKIENMNYIKMLRDYKDQTKRTIIGLKNIEKCFNPSNDKIMRIVIKYKGGDIKREVQQFQQSVNEFLGQVNNNFATFSVRQDYRQIIHGYLDAVKKIQVSDVRSLEIVPNLAGKLSEVYEKTSQQNKKQIRKSIGSFLAGSAAKQGNQQNQDRQYFSISNYMSKTPLCQSSNIGTPAKDDNRRSLSKGKGLSLMHINNTLNTSSFGQGKIPKAINICAPIEFNRTTIIRRDR